MLDSAPVLHCVIRTCLPPIDAVSCLFVSRSTFRVAKPAIRRWFMFSNRACRHMMFVSLAIARVRRRHQIRVASLSHRRKFSDLAVRPLRGFYGRWARSGSAEWRRSMSLRVLLRAACISMRYTISFRTPQSLLRGGKSGGRVPGRLAESLPKSPKCVHAWRRLCGYQ